MIGEPLAERMRPRSLDHFIGQRHLVGKGSILRTMIEQKALPSIILWGPPGVGKTSLSQIIAKELQRPFYTLSAINSGVKEVREVIEKAAKTIFSQTGNPILFIDEIHRFSKSQQDSLLGAVEKGIITLIGATTENPSFEVISALLSRCQTYVLKKLEKQDLIELIDLALKEDVFLKKRNIKVLEYEALVEISGGDARKLLNGLELVCHASQSEEILIDNKSVYEKIQENILQYDKNGEQHYDIISAFIKSIRGSDPNAALYWLSRMIESGEDPLFIGRRLIILASEDIGNANPTALVIANNCFQAVNVVGWPESRIILSQAVTYLACSAKSNSCYQGINAAQELVRNTGNLSVPLHLRNAPTKLMKDLNYGKGYEYAHEYKDNFINQEYMPNEISGTKFYEPGQNNREEELRFFLRYRWKEKYNY